nr:MAG TPA: hypothetical protein [Caudoviricetes sp.]
MFYLIKPKKGYYFNFNHYTLDNLSLWNRKFEK